MSHDKNNTFDIIVFSYLFMNSITRYTHLFFSIHLYWKLFWVNEI